MLFSAKLSSEIYAPWKQYYIAYDQLKKLLKESLITDTEWTEEDESRFVQLLDKELDKVCGFETKKFEEISERLSKVETQMQNRDTTKLAADEGALNTDLEQILDDATHLDRFRRLNYTAFVKIVRKHDRLHSVYRVMPLLQARFRSVPFHTEDYSPLLRRLSHIYTTMDEQSGGTSASSAALSRNQQQLHSVDKEYHSKGYVTLQYWVHPDNLMEVKTHILRKLPVLVYNREDDEDDSERDPIVTSLYLDNKKFLLYQSLLERDRPDSPALPESVTNAEPAPEVGSGSGAASGAGAGTGSGSESGAISGATIARSPSVKSNATSLRFRWYGRLYERPDIVLEQHNELDGRITRIVLKEKTIDKFLAGDRAVVEKQARKMRDRHVHSRAVDEFMAAATELQKFIVDNKLEPMLRTVYRRTAFEIPGDDRVRVILDQDIVFMREDCLSQTRPIRDPSKWHRTELDQPGIDPQSMLRKGEFARFPYSVLEVRLRAGSEKGVEKLNWIEELQKSNLIKEIPHFTKFLHGSAVLYGDDDRLDILPLWLSEFDSGREGENTSSGDAHGSGAGGGASAGGAGASSSMGSASVSDASVGGGRAGPSRRLLRSYKFDDDEDFEFDSDDSGVLDPALEAFQDEEELDRGDAIGLPTRIHSDDESEEDEVNLPPGVEQPSQWIKNQSSPKIEAKVWLANERTFNRWLHTTCLLSALTFTLYSSVSNATSSSTATLVAYILFGITIFSGVWGYSQYLLRVKYIKERGDRPMDAPLGPIIISIGLLAALIINFTAMYKNSTRPPAPQPQPPVSLLRAPE